MITESEIKKGQAVYTTLMLKLYNLWVLDISNRWIWRCIKQRQLDHFNRLIRSNHLDIGVGTGFYLYECKSPVLSQISLMDLNPNCLKASSNALKSRNINSKTYLADIYKPQPELANQFDSVSMNYLLHCLPGNMKTKGQCIAHATAMLIPGGILFGATILADPELHTKTSRSLCAFYNKKGFFSNQEDTLKLLSTALNKHLDEVHISVVGCVALFSGIRSKGLNKTFV